jgi:ubiquinone biosynthesis protein COQ9
MIFDSIETKQKILSQFLELVEFDSWSEETLKKAIRNSNIDDKFQNLIFENGCLDLIKFYIDQQNIKSSQLIEKIPDFKNLKIRDKIKKSLYSRFEVELENKIALQRLVNFYLDPNNFLSIKYGPKPLLQSLKSCYKIADFIWYNIGDKSTDFNFYTKRITLSKIILCSLFVFLRDDNSEFERTKRFIDIQIEKVMNFEKRKAKIKDMSSKVKSGFLEFILDENGLPKSPKKILKNLPFIRLFKF